MIHPYANLVGYKVWADRGLHDVVSETFDRLNERDQTILVQILDHIHVVDCVFQRHLQGLPQAFRAPRSEHVPDLLALSEGVKATGDWYARYVAVLSGPDFDQPLDFEFTNGTPGRLTRGEIILHVCLHGTYHRGNAGLLLQKNGIAPNADRLTDFLEAA